MSGSFVEFEVGTADLRRGLEAVKPHVQPDAGAPDTHRVRVEINQSGEIILLATDGWTAAGYACSGDNVTVLGMDYIDLHPADVIKILAVFKAGKDDDPDHPDSLLRVHATEKLLTIRDVSGLFEGHELELPATPPGQWPNIAMLAGEHLAAVGTVAALEKGPRRIQLTGKYLERFGKSAKAIGSPLIIDTDRAPLLIQCSDVFVGVVMPTHISEDQSLTYDRRRASWAKSLAQLGAAARARRAAEDEIDGRLSSAIRFVGVRQAATVKALRDELGIGQAEADQLLRDMEKRGLIGPAKRGKARPVLFGPDEVDEVLSTIAAGDNYAPDYGVHEPAPDPVEPDPVEPDPVVSAPVNPLADEPDAPMPSGPDWGDVDPGASEAVPTEWEATELEISGMTQEELHGPLDAMNAPADPFSDRPTPPDPFTDSDGNNWPTRDPFGPAE